MNMTRNMMKLVPLWQRQAWPRSPSSRDGFESVITGRPASSKRWKRKGWWAPLTGLSQGRSWLKRLKPKEDGVKKKSFLISFSFFLSGLFFYGAASGATTQAVLTEIQ